MKFPNNDFQMMIFKWWFPNDEIPDDDFPDDDFPDDDFPAPCTDRSRPVPTIAKTFQYKKFDIHWILNWIHENGLGFEWNKTPHFAIWTGHNLY